MDVYHMLMFSWAVGYAAILLESLSQDDLVAHVCTSLSCSYGVDEEDVSHCRAQYDGVVPLERRAGG